MSQSSLSLTPETAGLLLQAVSNVFKCFGRALVCLSRDFRIVHASSGLDDLVGEPVVEALVGRPVEEILGSELFGLSGTLRRALEAGELREGWGTTLRAGEGRPRLVSVTVAPLQAEPGSPCDPRVAFLVLLRPADEDRSSGTSAPTFFSSMVARSAAMFRIFHLIENLQESDATVLITGESGTGKELVARAIHLHSPRRNGPFVAVNCGALPGDLLESELFGHVRGAFTGAVRDRQGRFELASGGTLFLDEIGDLPLHLQVKLLRVLQERSFERVGESRSRQSDVRIIAATNQHLQGAVQSGDFREDLYYRLRVVPIEMPPLRERREDIEPLTHHLLGRVSRRHGRALILDPETVRVLLRYPWPGNVRELENALEYSLAVCRGQTIHPEDLPSELLSPPGSRREAPTDQPAGKPEVTQPASPTAQGGEEEKDRIRAALEANQWRRDETARTLGISRTTLWRKMREYGWVR